MHYADFSRGFVLKMDRGEAFHDTLVRFFEQKRFPSAFFQGIGALKDVDLGFFKVEKNDYIHHQLKGDYELITAMGNISLVEGKPVAHTHVCLADEKGQTTSGHLFEATVAVTVELFLLPIDIALLRKPDETLNFKSLDLPHLFVEH